ncbi:MAG: C40 family peptidase [Treponema sp.]|jgi:hypothetical protein|nr:C40 family peptidase [Treponema sp.]
MKTQALCFVLFGYLCSSCTGLNQSPELTPCPADIARQALEYAFDYSTADTEYEFGGQDSLRAIKIDCSGLAVNCYKYAVAGTDYYLPFYDAAVINFFREWSVSTIDPRPGDLIFMGDDKNSPTHMSLFVKKEGGNIRFIDSTLKPEELINGVSERHYPENDERFLSFGILLLKK